MSPVHSNKQPECLPQVRRNAFKECPRDNKLQHPGNKDLTANWFTLPMGYLSFRWLPPAWWEEGEQCREGQTALQDPEASKLWINRTLQLRLIWGNQMGWTTMTTIEIPSHLVLTVANSERALCWALHFKGPSSSCASFHRVMSCGGQEDIAIFSPRTHSE